MAQKNRTVIDPRQAERRRSLIYKIGAAVVLIIIAVGVTFWAINHNKDSASAGSDTPTVMRPDGSIRITSAPAGTEPKVVITTVEDFQCPGCRAFEQSFGGTLAELEKNPQVAVDYHPVAFLDRMSTTNYSSRAMNASTCVAENTAKKGDWSIWLKFHNLLFANQPEEGGAGLPDSELISLAKQAGADSDYMTTCIENNQFGQWVAKQTADTTNNSEFPGTPWIRINGQQFDPQAGPRGLTDAVNAALAK